VLKITLSEFKFDKNRRIMLQKPVICSWRAHAFVYFSHNRILCF